MRKDGACPYLHGRTGQQSQSDELAGTVTAMRTSLMQRTVTRLGPSLRRHDIRYLFLPTTTPRHLEENSRTFTIPVVFGTVSGCC